MNASNLVWFFIYISHLTKGKTILVQFVSFMLSQVLNVKYTVWAIIIGCMKDRYFVNKVKFRMSMNYTRAATTNQSNTVQQNNQQVF